MYTNQTTKKKIWFLGATYYSDLLQWQMNTFEINKWIQIKLMEKQLQVH